nr:hypothetical protein [Tanacetum cinerariifolium]
MASFDYRLNPLYPIQECSSCRDLYTTDYCCSDGSLGDKIICDLNQTPDLFQRPPQNCPKCGNPVDGHFCQGCALLRKKFKEDLFTYCIKNGFLQDSFKSSNDNTNVVNALQEPFVVKQDPKDILFHKCTCELCGRGAHYGYNCPPKVSVVSNPEPCHNQTVDELPQTLPSFDPICYSEDGNSFTYDSTSNLVHDSPNFFDPPSQPPLYLCEFCGNDARGPHEAYQCQPMNEDYYHEQNACYDPNSFGFDQFQPPKYTINHSIFNAQNNLFNSQNKLMEQLTSICDMVGQYIQKKEEEKQIKEEQAAKARYWKIPVCDDDDEEDYTIAVTPILSIDKPDNSLNQFEDFSDSNDESTSIDDDSFSIDNIEYVEASPPNSELVGSEVIEIVIPEVGGIDDDILLTIKDDILREKLLSINLLIANIEALKDNPAPSSDFMTKSSSTSLNFLLEETNTFDNSLPESETFCSDLEEISSGSTTTHSNIYLLEYEAFYDDHVKESDFLEFADELAHIISPPEYDYFCFKNEPNAVDFTMDVLENLFPTREPRVHNVLPTHPTLQLNLDFILSDESLFAYVVWIFLPFLSYSVAPQYLLSFGNEDTIFDPGISSHISSFMPDVSHRSGTFMKINVHPKHINESLMEILFSTCSSMDQ